MDGVSRVTHEPPAVSPRAGGGGIDRAMVSPRAAARGGGAGLGRRDRRTPCDGQGGTPNRPGGSTVDGFCDASWRLFG